ncbi:MAG: hypothetical protein KGZ76_13290 [Dethiobacter sp.]|nr:hypothetical protein [Dethiobacter sp.]
MVSRKSCKFIIVMAAIAVLLLAGGCGGRQAQSEPNEFMAWSFARGLVRSRLDLPNKAIFPQYSREFVERQGDDIFIVRAHVGAPDDAGTMVSYNFVVTAEYLGNQVFQETSVEITRAP